ncbi:MAG: NAD(P)H-dependent glycerol-3-phosphate dehydrogenase [Candidatus Poseidoniales archaeon]|jgi:glycerol-3-phosphate dehydrogenase (NAD(P)+)|nr:MAG: NAD(P)H-dependent glycerol-3-phosphate dehydrogenase [Candidatus Poseidoniales archaeon]|tara:strand:- start:945 stop:1955 length:1011 start_codon:yes stop_codon:yes gene_type:complete
MSRIGVLGLGNWGTALAKVWCEDGHNVTGWTIEQEVYESLMTTNINEKYLPEYEIPRLDVTMEMSDITDTCEILVLALPSGVILSVVNDLIPLLRPSHVLLDLAKGLAPTTESESGMISQEIEARLTAAGKANPVVILTGPTIAPEVARGVMTTAIVACHDRSVANRISERLSTESLVLTATDDIDGAELWGAYKNTVALACGLVDGLRGGIGGDNLKAALVLAGFSEGIKLLDAMGAEASTAFGPAGIGDLYVTATSPRSRNRTLGEKLGSGKSLEESLGEMHMVAEGVRANRMFLNRARRLDIQVPFLSALGDLLAGEAEVGEAVRRMVESYES